MSVCEKFWLQEYTKYVIYFFDLLQVLENEKIYKTGGTLAFH